MFGPRVQQTQREAVFGARLMVVQGELQSELGVIHVIAAKVRDYSHWLGRESLGGARASREAIISVE